MKGENISHLQFDNVIVADSTGHARYTYNKNVLRNTLQVRRSQLVSEDNETNQAAKLREDDLFDFNPTKTEVCAFTVKNDLFVMARQLQGVTLPIFGSIGIFCVVDRLISNKVFFGRYLEDKEKLASKKLDKLYQAYVIKSSVMTV